MKTKFIETLNYHEKYLKLIKYFAMEQDSKYSVKYGGKNIPFEDITNESLFDDFCEIYLFFEYIKSNSATLDPIDPEPYILAHDAWAIAKLFVIDDNNIKIFEEKDFIPIKVKKDNSTSTYYIEPRRLKQFINFGKLSDKEKKKDNVPIEVFNNWVNIHGYNEEGKEVPDFSDLKEFLRSEKSGGSRLQKSKQSKNTKGAPKPKTKTYLPDLHKCPDGRRRKAFRIKGKGNTLYVVYKGVVTPVSKIKLVGGGKLVRA
jgi:hypothetical protein